MSDSLAARYGHLADVVERGGRALPVALDPGPLSPRIVLADTPIAVDEELARAGAPHLAARRATFPALRDGAVVALTTIHDGVVHAAPSGYFAMVATCDALREETERGGPTPLRDRADALASPDPLRRGTGRAAAIGLSTALTVPHSSGRGVLLGRRRADLPLDPGRWHVIPSGMLEIADDPVEETLRVELAEEAGVTEPVRSRILGAGFDLLRLRPEVVARVDLDHVPVAGAEEFSEHRVVALDDLGSLWTQPLTPAAAIALALLERDEQDSVAN